MYAKKISFGLSLIIIITCICTTAEAKSVYAMTDHDAGTLKAYQIQGSQLGPPYAQAAFPGSSIDVTVDSQLKLLFLTFETGNIICVDANTLVQKGSLSTPQMAGIVADEAKQKVYSLVRGGNQLYVCKWDGNNLVLIDIVTLANLTGGWGGCGLALDKVAHRLYVSNNTNTVRYYDADDPCWAYLGSRNVGHPAMDIDVDPYLGYLYYGGFQEFTGDYTYLVKHNLRSDVNSNTEQNMGTSVIGLAVDPFTELVYVTTSSKEIRVYDCSSYPFVQTYSVGTNGTQSFPAGICLDFVLPVPIAIDSNVSFSSGTSQIITLQAIDDGLPNPPGALTYIITSLPKYGMLSDPCAGQIDTVPYSLVNYGRDVNYTSPLCYAGDVNFHFKANDGGTFPDGGDSNIATVSISVQQTVASVVYETYFDTGLPAGWTIIHGGSSTNTWCSDNPGYRMNQNWTGTFMIVDAIFAGSGNMDEQLITQSIDCTRLSAVKLRLKHYFRYHTAAIGDVDVRVNGGAWQNLARYQRTNFGGLVELDLSGFGADGAADVQIRWHYYNANWDNGYWGVDDVQIIAIVSPSVADLNFDCDVDYDDLAIFTSAWLTSPGQPNWNPDCDSNPSADGIINELDFAVIANNWRIEQWSRLPQGNN